MADNVGITTGTDATVGTDEVSDVHFQRVKLVDGTLGETTPVAVGEGVKANALRVALPTDAADVKVTLDSEAVVLGAGSAAIGKLAANDGVDIGNVDVASSALPTGAATAAKQDTIIGHVDGIEALLGTMDADTSALAGCVGGTEVQVDVVGALPAGTNAIGKLAANSGVDIGDVDVTSGPTGANALQVQGTVAHDSAAANNPVLVGVTAANAFPTAVANADVVRAIADLNGRLVVAPYTMPEKAVKYTSAADITDTSDDEAFAAPGAGVSTYITHFSAMCSHATTATWVYLKDGSTVIYSGYCAAAGGGFVATFPVPLKVTANAAVNVANATNSSATRVNVSGFQAPG